MKTQEREIARALRREKGSPIGDIAQMVGVSKSTISLWVRDIELTPEQHEALRRRNRAYDRQLGAHLAWARKCRDVRRKWQDEGRRQARSGDAMHAAGCMLYWAEGGKTRNQAYLSNADPEVVRFFVRFLRRYLCVEDEGLRVTCNLFADHADRQHEVEQFWLDHLELPRSVLRKSTVNVFSKYSQKKRTNMLPYGTCRVTVHRTRVVQHIYGAIQECGGFERPEWLD